MSKTQKYIWQEKTRTIITDTFDLGMLPRGDRQRLQFTPLSLKRAREYLQPGYLEDKADWESSVDSARAADIFSGLLEVSIPLDAPEIKLQYGTRLLVGQIKDLAEAEVEWWLVTVA